MVLHRPVELAYLELAASTFTLRLLAERRFCIRSPSQTWAGGAFPANLARPVTPKGAE
jgi:hypothetical protein